MVNTLISFKNFWSTFIRNYQKLVNQSAIDPNSELEFADLRGALKSRYEALRASSAGSKIPPELACGLKELSEVERISSLSDEQRHSINQISRNVEDALEDWIEKAKRQDSYIRRLKSNFQKRRFGALILVPASFVLLVLLFAVVSFKFFLNR